MNAENIGDIGGNEYRVESLDAMSQFHVVRRIAPIMANVGMTIAEMRASLGASEDDEAGKEEFMLKVMQAAMDVVAKMTDDDVNYVLFKCLAKAKRKQGEDGAARYMQVATGSNLQFQDLSMQDMVRLSIEVLRVSGVFRFFQEQTGV